MTKEDQKHICGIDPVRMGDITFKSKRKVTDKDIVKMQELERQGMSVSKIAIEIGVSRPTVIKYLKKAEGSRVQI
ncbi:TPA: helix-turn-helix domain-containing protein [Bacillus cereus]|uniref:helix-turn-helix domain-containing protein n=1 Tax=Bacillus cereus TaxID=1396 RepID=UPI00301651CD